jgi:hypothetical protein
MNAQTSQDVLLTALPYVEARSPILASKIRMIIESIEKNQYLFDLLLQMTMQNISADSAQVINIQAVEGFPAIVSVVKGDAHQLYSQDTQLKSLQLRSE